MTHRFANSDFSTPRDPMLGRLLIATRQLQSTPFARSVVYVIQDNDEGTFGTVLNQPATTAHFSAWKEMGGVDVEQRHLISGGPIGGPVIAIHQQREVADMELPGGIYLSCDRESIEQLGSADDEFSQDHFSSESPSAESADFRIVMGVAGWKPGQLEREIEEGCWFVSDAHAEQIFDSPWMMWEKSLRRHGEQTVCDLIGTDAIAGDCRWN